MWANTFVCTSRILARAAQIEISNPVQILKVDLIISRLSEDLKNNISLAGGRRCDQEAEADRGMCTDR